MNWALVALACFHPLHSPASPGVAMERNQRSILVLLVLFSVQHLSKYQLGVLETQRSRWFYCRTTSCVMSSDITSLSSVYPVPIYYSSSVYPVPIQYLSSTPLIFIHYSSSIHLVIIQYSFGTYPVITQHWSDIFPVFIMYPPGIYPVPISFVSSIHIVFIQ